MDFAPEQGETKARGLLALFNFVLSIGLVVAVIWGLITLADLRRGQAEIRETLARITTALAVQPTDADAMVTCEACGAQYAAGLTGCSNCGRPRSKNTEKEFTAASRPA